jgi:endonuclease YncB( thermonuclease family)
LLIQYIVGPIDPETGVPRTKYLTLSGIQCAEYSTQDKEAPRQQPLGHKAREYLRTLILGKKVFGVYDGRLTLQ